MRERAFHDPIKLQRNWRLNFWNLRENCCRFFLIQRRIGIIWRRCALTDHEMHNCLVRWCGNWPVVCAQFLALVTNWLFPMRQQTYHKLKLCIWSVIEQDNSNNMLKTPESNVACWYMNKTYRKVLCTLKQFNQRDVQHQSMSSFLKFWFNKM